MTLDQCGSVPGLSPAFSAAVLCSASLLTEDGALLLVGFLQEPPVETA